MRVRAPRAKLGIGVVVALQKMRGAENTRGVAGVKAGEAAVRRTTHPMTPIIGVDDARDREEMIRKPLGERAAVESIQSIKERILPVDHIEALNTNAKERRKNTKTEEMIHLVDGVVFEYREIKFDAL